MHLLSAIPLAIGRFGSILGTVCLGVVVVQTLSDPVPRYELSPKDAARTEAGVSFS